MLMIINEITPVRVHAYTSMTSERIFNAHMEAKEYSSIKKKFVNKFNECGIVDHYGNRVICDNKTVFEVKIKGMTFFYGFYDNKISIGLGCQSSRPDGRKYNDKYLGYTLFGIVGNL